MNINFDESDRKIIQNKLIIITGPTASGKSSAAIDLCKIIDGEIVSADSMQIYRGMNIGTAKPSSSEQQGVRHHMLDMIDPIYTYSVAQYIKDSKIIFKDIISRGKIPVVCGGTGQYISALIEGTVFTTIDTDTNIRKNLERELDEKGIGFLYNELEEIDPESAKTLHINDVKRILRAIEVFRLTGLTKTRLNSISKEKGPEFECISFCITHDREILYERINDRVDQMIKQGLIDEIKQLLTDFPSLSNTAYQAIGYKEFIPYLNNEISLDESIAFVKQATRNYAKRQLTWFRKIESLIWISNQDTSQVVDTIINNCLSYR
ncbi:MAG: tRNA (adenosine(37)-N6)-dimethylallyltransferase MiaA [Saccharofermentanales bacterium]